MTPAERALRRVTWRWEKEPEKWIPAATSVQRVQRGIASRALSDVLKASKMAMYSVVKTTLKAGEHVTMGKYDDAIFALSRAIRVDPGSRLAHLVRGRAYFATNLLDEALNDFTTVVMAGTPASDNDDKLRMRITLGDQYHSALTTFDRLKTFAVGTLGDSFHDPQTDAVADMIKIAGYANRGRVNIVKQLYQQAIEDFTEVIESRGEHGDIPSMYFFRGIAYSKNHEWYAAAEDFSLNVDLSPTDPDAYIRRSIAYGALQDWDTAYKDLSMVIEMDATPLSYAMRARLLCCMRRFPDAILDYKRALAMDKTYEPAVLGLAEATKVHDPLPLVSQHSG
jgi:tetratricopeptide (TPR) repeat protein